MTIQKSQKRFEIGMVGLGVMGRNLLLNMADHGFSVAGYDKDPEKVKALRLDSKARTISSVNEIKEFVALLRRPRAVMLLVPAGAPVDSVINDLMKYLQHGDLIIDAGNSYFKDTDLRTLKLKEKGIKFLGTGISGGEEGARHGPSIMPGGDKEAYELVRPVLEAIAAKVKGHPCVTYLGPGSAGHFVKMVHNGIEYAIMQLISETYDLLKRGLGLNDHELENIYKDWNTGDLNSYLIEITGHIFHKKDEETGKRLIDQILDVARQKGTGMWTSQSAMELQVPIPLIDIAVSMRDLSVYEEQRMLASRLLVRPIQPFDGSKNSFIILLKQALYCGMLIAYAQGLALLKTASEKYGYHLHLEEVARIWCGGCIIRSVMLDDIRTAFHLKHDLSNLFLDPFLSKKIEEHQEYLRQVVSLAIESGLPVPALMASLGYFDAYRSSWLPANLIQAQRDYFGAHTYERIDAKGTFHTEWLKKDKLNENE